MIISVYLFQRNSCLTKEERTRLAALAALGVQIEFLFRFDKRRGVVLRHIPILVIACGMTVLDFGYAQRHVLYDASRGVQHLRALIVGYLVLNRNRVCLGVDEPVLQAFITYEHLHGGDRYFYSSPRPAPRSYLSC